MDLKLTEEERLIQSTAAQFVKKELLTREVDYLRQQEVFSPPGDPLRRRLDPPADARTEGGRRLAGSYGVQHRLLEYLDLGGEFTVSERRRPRHSVG